MTFATFSSTDHLNCYTIILLILNVLVEFFVNAVKFISISFAIVKLNFGSTVTIDAPAHAQVCKLFYLGHVLNFSMTCLAGNLANFYVLGMVEINKIRKIVDLDPLDRLAWLVVGFCIWIPAGIFI